MKNRKERIAAIVDLIKNNSISNQDELSNLLHAKGFEVTQATLSRDLKMLKTSKVPNQLGSYMYVLPENYALKNLLANHESAGSARDFQQGFISLEFSGNLAVIKTRNGYAAGLAYDIDMSNSKEILGTIPGSDTIIAVIAEHVTREEILNLFCKFLPIDKSKYL